MSTPADSPLKRTSLHAAHVALGARMVPFGGWDMPVEYSGITRRAPGRAHRAGLFDVIHMGADRDGRPERAGRRPAPHHQRRGEAAGRADAVLGADDARRHVRRRRARLPVGARATSCWSSTPRTSRRTTPGSSHNAPAAGEVAVVNSSDRYALIAVQGPKARAILQSLTGVTCSSHQVLLVRARRSRRRPRHRLAHRLHRRGRLRDLRAAAVRAGAVEGAPRGGQAARPRPGRSRRARHAAPRGGDAALRQRHGRDHDGPRSRPRLDRRLEQAGFHRPRGAAPRRRPRASPRSIVGFEMVDRAIARHGYPVHHDGAEVGKVTSGTQTPFLKKAIGMAYVPGGAGARRAPRSTSTSAAARAQAARRADAVLQAPALGATRCIRRR